MNLVFLHGPPASGKLTIARELAALTGYRVFHNHLTVDAVSAVFDFGTGSFVELRERIWLAVFREAARSGVSLIFTFAPERTVRPTFVPETVAAVEAEGGRVLFAELTCPVEELELRMTDRSRDAFGKLRSVALFQELQAQDAFAYPPMPESGLRIDTSLMSPSAAALRVAAFFALPELP